MVPVVPLLAVLLTAIPVSAAQPSLKTVLNAHGGLSRWEGFGSVEYDVVGWPTGEKGVLADHQLVDLKSHQSLITSEKYRIGNDGKEVWVTPHLNAVGMPPGYYAFAAFHFFAMPFVLAEAGAQAEPGPLATFQGGLYETWRVIPSTASGAPAGVVFTAYASTATHRIRLVTYSAPGRPNRAVVYEKWQDADDLLVPSEATLYVWEQDQLGTRLGTYAIAHVNFEESRPVPEMFARPGGAVVDSSYRKGTNSW